MEMILHIYKEYVFHIDCKFMVVSIKWHGLKYKSMGKMFFSFKSSSLKPEDIESNDWSQNCKYISLHGYVLWLSLR